MPENMNIENLQKLMISNGLKLSVAESCTGGNLSAMITGISGSSKYFLGGIVAYSNELKKKLLGVDPLTLEREGAVSEAVVIQMAEGMIKLTKSDYAIAVSGIAGPEGGTKEKPVGTIFGAITKRGDKTDVWKFNFKGTRLEIIEQTCLNMLAKLFEKVYERDSNRGSH